MSIPFVDVAGQTALLHDELMAAVDDVLRSAAFVGGPHVAAFEAAFVAALGLPPGAGCSSGTSALSLLFEAAGIGPGDEVIVPSHTFIATAEAVCHVGATPVFAEIEPRSYDVDPDAVAAAVTDRTRAIVPVHLYGTPAAMDPLLDIAARHDLVVIEDAAQAHLATYRGRPAGGIGHGAGFSFYPGKNLGALGDAGFLVSRDADLLARARKLLDHGRTTKYEHDVIGYNHRMDAVQAAMLSVKLRRLAEWTEHRRAAARHYDGRLAAAGFKVIDASDDCEPVYHLYVVEVSNRDAVLDALRAEGIGCGIHYPVPLHRQAATERFGHGAGSLPVTERVASRVLSLPIDGTITESDVDRACDVFLAVAQT